MKGRPGARQPGGSTIGNMQRQTGGPPRKSYTSFFLPSVRLTLPTQNLIKRTILALLATQVIYLDEPTTGLDPISRQACRQARGGLRGTELASLACSPA